LAFCISVTYWRMGDYDTSCERDAVQRLDSVAPMTDGDRRLDARVKTATVQAVERSRRLIERCELFLAELPWGKKS